ncbi:MAG: formate dehydrogenase [Xanthobacteraceae bacterium]
MKKKDGFGRRDFFRVFGAGVTITASGSLIKEAGAAEESSDEKRKARYQANSPDVQDFYRVSRYPATSD